MQTQIANQLNTLPKEVAQIAENVSLDKRNEVQSVLNHVFNGVSKMKEQLDNVVVLDPNDKVNMKLANTIRLGVRQVRLDAEKTFDAKRNEVQAQMLSFKTEDQLWLKAKQTMQLLTKEIEEKARWKEETRERYEAEQRELKMQQRIIKVSKVAPELHRSEFENMSDQTFDVFFSGLEKEYNDKIEVAKKTEQERIEKERAEKAERERIRIENEKLKAEAEAREKEIQKEKAKAERERKEFEEKVRKEKAEKDAMLKAEREAREKAENEIKAQKEKEEREVKEKLDAEKKFAKAGEKEKLRTWLAGFTKSTIEYQPKGESGAIKEEIEKKFDAFILWANSQINAL